MDATERHARVYPQFKIYFSLIEERSENYGKKRRKRFERKEDDPIRVGNHHLVFDTVIFF